MAFTPTTVGKNCPKCKTFKGLSCFSKHHSKKDGLAIYCRECSRECGIKYRNRNKLAAKPLLETISCSKCNIEKSTSLFQRDNQRITGYRAVCKECQKNYSYKPLSVRTKAYQEEFATKEIEIRGSLHECTSCKESKGYDDFFLNNTKRFLKNSECKECTMIKQKGRYDRDKKKILASMKEYRDSNKEIIRERKKKYATNNRDKINAWTRRRQKEREQEEPLFRLKRRIQKSIKLAFIDYQYKKPGNKTEQILGCSVEVFKSHMEAQFTDGMNWSNAGKWHIDHRIPLAVAKSPAHIYLLSHYSNLQPLWAEDNIRKGAKYAI